MTQTVPDLPTEPRRPGLMDRISIVWLVPFAALAISLWVAWQSYADRGPLIQIVFDEASGIHAGETELRYRDVTVGLVEDVSFAPTLDTVVVSVRLDTSVADFADADADFWIVQPEVTTQGVSGLDTVLSGVFIEASWDTDPKGLVTRHDGTSTAPLLRDGQSGLLIRMTAGPGTQLVADTPILHKGIEVGRIGEPVLAPDGAVASAQAVIFAPYDRFVSSTTRFWDTSGFTFSLGPNGAEIDFSSLASLIAGGVAFDTIISGGARVEEGTEFIIYADEQDARASLFEENSGPALNLTAVFEENFSGLSVGAPVFLDDVRIGEVDNLTGLVDEARFGDDTVRLSTTMSLRTSGLGLPDADPETVLDYLDSRVEAGLRARLATASILTGGLKVEMVTIPDVSADALNRDGEPFPIIPVATSNISDVAATAEGVMERINKLPIEELLQAATSFLESATVLASSDELKGLPAEAKGLVTDMRGLIGSEDIKAVPAQITALITDLQALTKELRATVKKVDDAGAVDRLLAAVDAAADAAEGVDTSVAGVPALVEKLTDVATKAEALELQALVSELSATIASARSLIDSEGTQKLPARLGEALGELEAALAELREGGAVTNLNATMASAKSATEAVEAAVADLPRIVARLDAVAAQASATLAGFDEGSELNRSARSMLREVQEAARAIEQLARTLERRPNSVILGR